MKLLRQFLILNTLIFANIGGMDYIKKIKESNWGNAEIASRMEKLPRELNYAVAQVYFKKMLENTDFITEKGLIDSFNAFNSASKITNQVVKDSLKNKEKSDPKYQQLVVTGNPTKTISKQFTQLKLDAIENNINSIISESDIAKDTSLFLEYKQFLAARSFRAYNWSNLRSKSDPNYQEELNDALIRNLKLYEKDPEKLLLEITVALLLGANPNTVTVIQSLGYRSSILGRVINDKNISLIEVLLEFGADPNFVMNTSADLSFPIWVFPVLSGESDILSSIFKNSKVPINLNILYMNAPILFSAITFAFIDLYTNIPSSKITEFNKALVLSRKDFMGTLKILLENGADPNVRASDGSTALSLLEEAERNLKLQQAKMSPKKYQEYQKQIETVKKLITDAINKKGNNQPVRKTKKEPLTWMGIM